MTATAPSTALTQELTLSGSYGYLIRDNRIQLTIDKISSHRDLDNLSGSLLVELRGYGKDGSQTVLASTAIGQLTGQHFFPLCHYDLPFQPPQSGHWQLAVELREWDGKQYALLDQRFFDHAYIVDDAKKVSEKAILSTEDNVIVADFNPVDTTDATESLTMVTESTSPTEKKPSAPKGKAEKNAKKKSEKDKLSVNHSTLEELASLKGLPKKVAKEIIENRPHPTWEALLAVKGIGPKLLKKLSKGLKLN